MSADQRRSSRSYPTEADGAIRYVPVTRGNEIVGYLWAAIDGEAASFRATDGDNLDRLGVSAAWDGRLRESYAEGLTPLAALRHWVGAPEDPRGGGISPDAEEREAASETAMMREVIDPNYVDRSDQWEELLFQGDDRARKQYLDLKNGLAVGVPTTSYPFSLTLPSTVFRCTKAVFLTVIYGRRSMMTRPAITRGRKWPTRRPTRMGRGERVSIRPRPRGFRRFERSIVGSEPRRIRWPVSFLRRPS
jgi:hypothetical protein